MGHFAKSGVLLALGVFLAPTAPATASEHHRAVVFRPCHAGWVARRERPVHLAPGISVVGVVTGALPPAPWPYPVGYDGSSATPTGYGVIYNVPPASNLMVKREPDFPREVRVVVLRGGVVTAAY